MVPLDRIPISPAAGSGCGRDAGFRSGRRRPVHRAVAGGTRRPAWNGRASCAVADRAVPRPVRHPACCPTDYLRRSAEFRPDHNRLQLSTNTPGGIGIRRRAAVATRGGGGSSAHRREPRAWVHGSHVTYLGGWASGFSLLGAVFGAMADAAPSAFYGGPSCSRRPPRMGKRRDQPVSRHRERDRAVPGRADLDNFEA